MLSIIIPTRDRADVLARTLESVARALDAHESVEVIVVDNGSTDATAEVFRTTRRRFPQHSWRYFHDRMPGLLSGRHRGASESKGEILCYLDDDVLLATTWVSAVRDAFQDPDTALMGGPSLPLYEISPPRWLDKLWYEEDGGRMLGVLSLVDYGAKKRRVEPRNVWGLNFSVRRHVFETCGGFHPDAVPSALLCFRGDGESGLAQKIKDRGLQTLYHPDAAVTHMIPASRLTVRAFERRAFAQGISDSYTRIRENGVARPAGATAPSPAFCAIDDNNHGALAPAAVDSEFVRERCAAAYKAGVAFHEEHVANDPRLFEWVVKPDYFDYTLPAGWEERLESSRRSRPGSAEEA